MDPEKYLPFWGELDRGDREFLLESAQLHRFARGETFHNGSETCDGLFLVLRGRLRIYTVSREGRELTLYRLMPGELCLFSAVCLLRGIRFEVMVEAQEESEVFTIPSEAYHRVMEHSAAAANFTCEVMAERFSDLLWLLDQVLNQKMDSRLAALLVGESRLARSPELGLTHEQLAGHLGSAREVVTRLLREFQKDGLVRLSRGSIRITDPDRLLLLAGENIREKP